MSPALFHYQRFILIFSRVCLRPSISTMRCVSHHLTCIIQSQRTCLVVCKLFIHAPWETNLSTKVQPFCGAPFGFHLVDFIHVRATYIRILVHHSQCDWYIHSSSLQSLSTVIFLNWHPLNLIPGSLQFMGSDKGTLLQSHRVRVAGHPSTQPALVLIRLTSLHFFPESPGTQLCYNKTAFIFVRNTKPSSKVGIP